MSDPKDKLLTPDELGEVMGVCGATVRKWHRQGSIPAEVHEGSVIRFNERAVRAALKRRARERDAARVTELSKMMVPTL